MKTKRCFNYFTIADFEREERWLNAMGRRGWHFVSTNGLVYRFEQGRPAEYIYKIDLPDGEDAAHRADYEHFLSECGVEVVAHFKEWVYLRRRASEGPIETADNTRAQLSLINRASGYAADVLCRLLCAFAALSVVSLIVASLLAAGSPAAEFLHGFGMSVAVSAMAALALMFTPVMRRLRCRADRLMREMSIRG